MAESRRFALDVRRIAHRELEIEAIEVDPVNAFIQVRKLRGDARVDLDQVDAAGFRVPDEFRIEIPVAY